MDLNYNNINLFPTIIHQFDVNGFSEIKKDLIKYAYDIKHSGVQSVLISNYGGWQSPPFQVKNEYDVLQKFIINCLSGFPVILESTNIKVEAWININKPGDYNIKHNHPNSNLAGVLWIQCPQNSGDIVFESPNDFQTYNEIESYNPQFKIQNKFHHTYCFNPVEGRILVFPAHLSHSVNENKSYGDRISVSFNINLENG